MKRSTGEHGAATFIIRLWQEPREMAGSSAIWRGTAVHVQSGAERGVQGMEDLRRFMETWIQPMPPDSEEGA